MTAKRSPLDFIINDRPATEETNKGPENTQRRSQHAVTDRACQPTTGGIFQKQTRVSVIKEIHISTRLFQ